MIHRMKLHARGRAPTNLLLVDLIASRVLHIDLNINLILAKSQALFKTDVILFLFCFEMLNETEISLYCPAVFMPSLLLLIADFY